MSVSASTWSSTLSHIYSFHLLNASRCWSIIFYLCLPLCLYGPLDFIRLCVDHILYFSVRCMYTCIRPFCSLFLCVIRDVIVIIIKIKIKRDVIVLCCRYCRTYKNVCLSHCLKSDMNIQSARIEWIYKHCFSIFNDYLFYSLSLSLARLLLVQGWYWMRPLFVWFENPFANPLPKTLYDGIHKICQNKQNVTCKLCVYVVWNGLRMCHLILQVCSRNSQIQSNTKIIRHKQIFAVWLLCSFISSSFFFYFFASFFFLFTLHWFHTVVALLLSDCNTPHTTC